MFVAIKVVFLLRAMFLYKKNKVGRRKKLSSTLHFLSPSSRIKLHAYTHTRAQVYIYITTTTTSARACAFYRSRD